MNIGIIGSGTMGNGIAHVFSLYNHKVILVDINKTILNNAYEIILKNLNRQYKKNHITESDMKSAISNIQLSSDLEDLSDCDLIIEAVKEDYKIKSEIFQRLDNICCDKTIFASNTSSISINDLSNVLTREDKFIGMHFMNPVPIMKLVEIIKGSKTSLVTVAFIEKLSISIDKIPVKCNDSPGFVSNRILMPMINEAAYCYMEGVADPKAIDSIMKLGMGHPMGPLRLADLIGIDVCVYILNVLYDGLKDEKYKPCPLLNDMIKKNKLGNKTKEGFYNYEL